MRQTTAIKNLLQSMTELYYEVRPVLVIVAVIRKWEVTSLAKVLTNATI